jgi:beta-carotene 3-hydroxylase
MHGPGWPLHASHHRPRSGAFEANDWYAAIFAIPSLALFLLADRYGEWLWWVGLGIALYGLVYAGFHDVIVHKRLAHRYVPRSRYMKRIVQAHRLHHAVEAKHGTVSFGFLWAPPAEVLKAELVARDRAGVRAPAGRQDGVRAQAKPWD